MLEELLQWPKNELSWCSDDAWRSGKEVWEEQQENCPSPAPFLQDFCPEDICRVSASSFLPPDKSQEVGSEGNKESIPLRC